MNEFSGITSKACVTVVHDGDIRFFEKVKTILETSSTRYTPVTVKDWMSKTDEIMTEYSAIVIFSMDVLDNHSSEAISFSIANMMPGMIGQEHSPLSTQQILLCRVCSLLHIETFCELHSLNVQRMIDDTHEVTYWSMSKANKNKRYVGLLS